MRIDDFFSTKRIRYNAATVKSKTCSQCGLYREKQNPRIKPFGDFRLKILNIGEAPGETEDHRGKPWQGKVGQALQTAYRKLDIDLFKDCLNINSVACRPTDKKGNNRPPTEQEINNCRRSVMNTIEESKPDLIMLLGNAAMKSVIGGRWKKDLGSVGRWTNWPIPDRDLNAWIYCTYHPSFTERGDKEIETIWHQHLRRGLSLIHKKRPRFTDEKKDIVIINDLSTIRDKIRSPFAVDYETTGLKPHKKEIHDIICGSICFEHDRAFAFMMTERNRAILKALLESTQYKKIAANLKFEHTWSREILDCNVKGWLFDTMLGSHVLDNRSHVTGLKFQVYTQFGLIDYDSEISPYLESTNSKDGNSTNKIRELIKTELGREKLLTYCGLDSLFEFRLAMSQMKKLGNQFN